MKNLESGDQTSKAEFDQWFTLEKNLLHKIRRWIKNVIQVQSVVIL